MMYENSSDQMISMTLFRLVTGGKMMMIHKSGDADSGVRVYVSHRPLDVLSCC